MKLYISFSIDSGGNDELTILVLLILTGILDLDIEVFKSFELRKLISFIFPSLLIYMSLRSKDLKIIFIECK